MKLEDLNFNDKHGLCYMLLLLDSLDMKTVGGHKIFLDMPPGQLKDTIQQLVLSNDADNMIIAKEFISNYAKEKLHNRV